MHSYKKESRYGGRLLTHAFLPNHHLNVFDPVTLMYPLIVCVIQVALSSNNIVGASFIEDNPRDFRICWIINFNHMHS